MAEATVEHRGVEAFSREASTELLAPQDAEERLGLGPADRAVLFVDFDGTLTPIVERPEDARLSERAEDALRKAAGSPRLETIIISGREQSFLEQRCGGLGLRLAAEHGALLFDRASGSWTPVARLSGVEWRLITLPLFRRLSSRLPGSRIEEKRYCLVFHYRLAADPNAEHEVDALSRELEHALHGQPVTISRGKKILEVREPGAHKGQFVEWYLQRPELEQALCIAVGDDDTDEDMFVCAQLRGGFGIKVGPGATAARLRLTGTADVLVLLEKLAASR